MITGTHQERRHIIDKNLRSVVLERDGYKCRLCKISEDLEIHHKVSITNGGNDNLDNLLTLCPDCHIYIHSFDKRMTIKDGIKAKKERIAAGLDTWKGRGKDKKQRKNRYTKVLDQSQS